MQFTYSISGATVHFLHDLIKTSIFLSFLLSLFIFLPFMKHQEPNHVKIWVLPNNNRVREIFFKFANKNNEEDFHLAPANPGGIHQMINPV